MIFFVSVSLFSVFFVYAEKLKLIFFIYIHATNSSILLSAIRSS